MIPQNIINPKGCKKEVKALGDIFYCGQDIGLSEKEMYFCPDCQNIQKAQAQTLLDEKKNELEFLRKLDNLFEHFNEQYF